MQDQDYYAIKDRLSPSMISTILTGSPADVQRRLIYGTEPTPAMARGTLGHAAILEPERVKDEFVLFDRSKLLGSGSIAKKPKYKKDGTPDQNTENLLMVQEFQNECEAKGKTAVLDPEEFENIMRVAGILYRHPFWQRINEEALTEHAMLWVSSNGCPMRGKADHISPNIGLVTDVKFMSDVSPEAVIRNIYDRCYHAQVAAYQDGFETTNNHELKMTMGAVIAIDIKTLEIVAYGLPGTFDEQKYNWSQYYDNFSLEAGRPIWKDISIQTGREIYLRVCQRWHEWNERFGNVWECREIIHEGTGEVSIQPVHQWPGWDYISAFQNTGKLKLFKL